MTRGPSFAVVIPAHDEETVIDRCLRFTDDLEPGEAEVVVVANGCHDATAETASRPGVRVIELDRAGKAEALNVGDGVTSTYPRIYLDADITVGAPALRRMRDALLTEHVGVCAPDVRFSTGGRPWPVRAFYRIYAQLPYVRDNLIGLGVYGVSEAGRRRFGAFPPLTNDDTYVQRLFPRDERLVLTGDHFTVQTPRDLGSLIRVRARITAGNVELSELDDDTYPLSTRRTGRALLALVAGRPQLAPHAVVYLVVTLLARHRAQRLLGARNRPGDGAPGISEWLRDSSTR